MQAELQKQIEEKQRKKMLEKEKSRLEDERLEMRVRQELNDVNRNYLQAKGLPPPTDPHSSALAASKNAANYQNHRSLNVVGGNAA